MLPEVVRFSLKRLEVVSHGIRLPFHKRDERVEIKPSGFSEQSACDFRPGVAVRRRWRYLDLGRRLKPA